MTWSKERPTQPGWYWFRNVSREDYRQARIVELRMYKDEIALGNSILRGFTLFEEGEFYGPLEVPHE